jgi:acetylornithine deacetylase/succinyl-diaminopimelate desuccinylase-like protein
MTGARERRRGPCGLAILLAVTWAAGACAPKETPLHEALAPVLVPPKEWLKKEPVRWLRDDIRINTTNPPGHERAAAEYLGGLLACEGIPYRILCAEGDRCNIVARLAGKRHDGALLLLNHLDVVPAPASLWLHPPFEGVIDQGYLYGRGAIDMKNYAIAQLCALVALKRSGAQLAHDIVFIGEAAEESFGPYGVEWLLAKHPEVFDGVSWVLNEGGVNESVTGEARYWGIEIQQGGLALAELTSSDPDRLGRFARRFADSVRPEAHLDPVVLDFFDRLAEYRPVDLASLLRDPGSWRIDPARMEDLPWAYRALVVNSINLTPVYRFLPGFRPTADAFGVQVVVSTPPGVDPAPLDRQLLEEAKGEGIHVLRNHSVPVTPASPFPTPMTAEIERVVDAVHPGASVGAYVVPQAYSSCLPLRRAGIACYGFSPFQIGLQDSSRRHGNNERIFLPAYLDGVELYRLLVADFASGRPN